MEVILFLAALRILYQYLKCISEKKINDIYEYDRKIHGNLSVEETARYEKLFGRKIHNGKSMRTKWK